MSDEAKKQDPLISFKGVSHKKDSKGNDRSVIYLTITEAQKLYEALAEVVTNQRGINFDIHFTTPTYEGRTFDSGYLFVKGTQESPSARGAGAPTRFEKVTESTSPAAKTALRDRVASVKAKASAQG